MEDSKGGDASDHAEESGSRCPLWRHVADGPITQPQTAHNSTVKL